MKRESIVLGVFVCVLSFFAGSVPVYAASYYVSPQGSDNNVGSESSPWNTMQKAVEALSAGDTLYVREGTYETIEDAWRFQATGTEENPITVRNYPDEQAVFKINSLRMERRAFRCGGTTARIGQANNIKLLGSDISSPRTLSNGIVSRKGLVVLGILGANAIGIESNMGGCNNWEVAGFDFVETGGGIFQRNGPSVNWYVHDNRVYNFYRESGMQFNGHNNRVVNNEIYLVNSLPRTYGCQMINLLGHGNVVRNNKLTRAGSTHRCIGILFEWDMADENVIEQNSIEDVPTGIGIQGGDHNIIRNNSITSSALAEQNAGGINIVSYDNRAGWPCDETTSPSSVLLPPNDPNNPDYHYFYNPRNCHSMANEIGDNQITGFTFPVKQGPVVDSTNIIGGGSVTTTQIPVASPTPRTVKQGDANEDGSVNNADYTIWLSNYMQSVFGQTRGDFNNSGGVDGIDYVMWLINYGR